MRLDYVKDDQQWDALVTAAPAGTVFHTSSWSCASPHSFVRIGVFNDRELCAGAILQINTQGTGTLGTLAPYLGPVFAASSGLSAYARDERAARSLTQGIKAAVPQATFFTSPWLDTLQPLLMGGYTAQLLYTRVVSLRDLEKVQAEFSPSLRRNIKAAERGGMISVLSADPSALLPLVRLSFSRQDSDIWFSMDEAEHCMKNLVAEGKATFIYALAGDGAAVAGIGMTWDQRRAYYILGGHDHTTPHGGGMSVALWRAMQFTRLELGLMEFDLEGSHIPGVARFFRQFGGRWRPFYYVKEGAVDFAE